MISPSAGDALGVREREAHGGVRAHRGARRAPRARRRARRAPPRGPRRAARSRRRSGSGAGRRAAVAARVVGDHAMPGALQRARAHHDVATRRREAVQQHDRRCRSPLSSPESGDAVGARTLNWLQPTSPRAHQRRSGVHARRARARARPSARAAPRRTGARRPRGSRGARRVSARRSGGRSATGQHLIVGAVDDERRHRQLAPGARSCRASMHRLHLGHDHGHGDRAALGRSPGSAA